MTFAQRKYRLTTHFSGSVPFVKRRMSLFSEIFHNTLRTRLPSFEFIVLIFLLCFLTLTREREREREREGGREGVTVVVITQGRQDVLFIIFSYVDGKRHIHVAVKSHELISGDSVTSLTQKTRL